MMVSTRKAFLKQKEISLSEIRAEAAKKRWANGVIKKQKQAEIKTRADEQAMMMRRARARIYLNRVLKQVHPEMRITSKGMAVMNAMVNDPFDRLLDKSTRLVKYGKTRALSSREIQTSVRLVMPGELAKHVISEGTKAMSKYSDSLT